MVNALSPAPGLLLARGVCRALGERGFACLTEFVPTRGLRTDVTALGPHGEIWTVEVKSSLADFRSDSKWMGYPAWCDRFFFAVPEGFPDAVLPPEFGLIRADPWGADILRDGPEARLAPARRKALTLAFARTAAERLGTLSDPTPF